MHVGCCRKLVIDSCENFLSLTNCHLFEGISLTKHMWSYLGASVLLWLDDDCIYQSTEWCGDPCGEYAGPTPWGGVGQPQSCCLWGGAVGGWACEVWGGGGAGGIILLGGVLRGLKYPHVCHIYILVIPQNVLSPKLKDLKPLSRSLASYNSIYINHI